jgi:hypothetical protein
MTTPLVLDALAESTVGSFKTGLRRRQGPWRDAEHVEIGNLNWVHWFNTERPHVTLDDLTPAAAEALRYRTSITPNATVHRTRRTDTTGQGHGHEVPCIICPLR